MFWTTILPGYFATWTKVIALYCFYVYASFLRSHRCSYRTTWSIGSRWLCTIPQSTNQAGKNRPFNNYINRSFEITQVRSSSSPKYIFRAPKGVYYWNVSWMDERYSWMVGASKHFCRSSVFYRRYRPASITICDRKSSRTSSQDNKSVLERVHTGLLGAQTLFDHKVLPHNLYISRSTIFPNLCFSLVLPFPPINGFPWP